MAGDHHVRPLPAAEARGRLDELVDVLADCVAGGASVGFLAGVTAEELGAFWRAALADRARVLLVAERDGAIDGTVVVVPVPMPNQPHRAELTKMLVHRRARGSGVGAALLAAAEAVARDRGRWLLVLDTVTGSAADRLYSRHGWQRVGEVPGYALMPDGSLTPTTFFWKDLRPA